MRSIVLAYDGSEAARRALARTAELANGASVTIVSAVHVTPPAGRSGVTVDQDEVEERRAELAEASSFLESKGVKPETVELHAMDIGKAVVDQAREGGADLIVVGTGQKNAAKRLILGSVSTKVVHEASCDVLVVR